GLRKRCPAREAQRTRNSLASIDSTSFCLSAVIYPRRTAWRAFGRTSPRSAEARNPAMTRHSLQFDAVEQNRDRTRNRSFTVVTQNRRNPKRISTTAMNLFGAADERSV